MFLNEKATKNLDELRRIKGIESRYMNVGGGQMPNFWCPMMLSLAFGAIIFFLFGLGLFYFRFQKCTL